MSAQVYADDMRKIVACLPALEALSAVLDDDYISSPVRVWNHNGWSHGYWSDTELGWAFTFDYTETQERVEPETP